MYDLLIYNDIQYNKQITKNYKMLVDCMSSPSIRIENDAGSRAEQLKSVLDIAEKTASYLGMDELVDISQKDRLRIPVYSISGKRKSDLTINYNNGKGFTADQAKMSALMEYVERQSPRCQQPTALTDSFYNIRKKFIGEIVSPSELITYYSAYIADTIPINWYPAINLCNSSNALIPTIAVLFPYASDSIPLFRNNTNGLSAGTSFIEAIIQGIYEVIERDCASLAMAARRYKDVPIDSVNSPKCRYLINEFLQNGIDLYIKDISNEFGIPCFSVAGDDRLSQNSLLLCGGHGCHAQKEVALLRALTELAQTRKTILYGKREDIVLMRPNASNPDDYNRIKEKYSEWYTHKKDGIGFGDIPELHFSDLYQELCWLLHQSQLLGFNVYAINLSIDAKEYTLPVVRVIMPGLENRNEDMKRIGLRLYHELQKNKANEIQEATD